MGKYVQRALLAAYLGVTIIAFFDARTPCLFWTILMPAVPLAVVVGGFHWWRRVCPIATFGALGARLGQRVRSDRARRKRRRWRMPRAMQRLTLPISFAGLFACLVLRLVATNGHGPALGLCLAALPLLAAAFNAVLGGRAWCHFACPVGAVERIYTDAGALRPQASSRCAPCTGCKKGCADIDQGRGYRTDTRAGVFYAFPGLVFGFYAYYWVRGGDWEAFFGGAWTQAAPAPMAPGVFFLPEIPTLLAAPATLAACALATYTAASAIERVLAARTASPGRLRHRMIAIASFTAFNVFYVFAGAPTLRRIPFAPDVVAFVVPVVATLVLVRRWRAEVTPPAPAARAIGADASHARASADDRRVALPIAQ